MPQQEGPREVEFPKVSLAEQKFCPGSGSEWTGETPGDFAVIGTRMFFPKLTIKEVCTKRIG
jgi:hypothetical protein